MQEVLIILIIFGAIFGIVLVIATARNRERMAMIDKDVNPKDFMVREKRKFSVFGLLKWGLLLAGIGIGLFLGSLLDEYTSLPAEPGYFAAPLFFGGLGLIIAFLIQKKAAS